MIKVHSTLALGEELRRVVIAPDGSGREAELVEASEREDGGRTFYDLEYAVHLPDRDRHELATVVVDRGRLYTFATSTNEMRWPKVKGLFHQVILLPPCGSDRVLIVGGGLAGGLLALALGERGIGACLIAGQQRSATEWSYGVIPGWPLGTSALAIRSAKAAGLWRDLLRRCSDLGWYSARIHLHGGKPWARFLHLRGCQVDTARFHARLPELLKKVVSVTSPPRG